MKKETTKTDNDQKALLKSVKRFNYFSEIAKHATNTTKKTGLYIFNINDRLPRPNGHLVYINTMLITDHLELANLLMKIDCYMYKPKDICIVLTENKSGLNAELYRYFNDKNKKQAEFFANLFNTEAQKVSY